MQEIRTNRYQTPVTEDLINSLPEEVGKQLLEYINTVPFIQSLISPERKYARDLPRDSKGRIIVDIIHPHILENMDYFRPSAIHYEKYGCYTKLRPNPNPNSDFGKWLHEEVRRCWDGYIREEDGEWITGDMYFYMNYSPIMISDIVEGTNTANRIEAFPETWEGIYWRYHCLEQARWGGMYDDFKGGKHMAELAKRGCSKSYTLASMMAKHIILGENAIAHKRTMTILTAYQKGYLSGQDGTLNKFTPMIDFCSDNTQFPRSRITDSKNEMTWKYGYKDAITGVERGSLNTVIGVSSKDDEGKLRGKRGYILIEEFGSFPRLITIYNIIRQSVEEGNFTFGLIYLVGTAGDKESDFSSAQELLYNSDGYNIYTLPNVYDKVTQGKRKFAFFFPAYVSRKGCYNKDGVTDIIKALIEILMIRYKTKYNTSDPNTLTKTIAEMPVTPSEAIIKVRNNLFPITQLNERIDQIDNAPDTFDGVYTGDLTLDATGEVKYKMTSAAPIRIFPTKDNKVEGAIEIFEMPLKEDGKKVFNNRYYLGVDPYDDDASDTMSLGSVFVLDLWTDRIVAEYTGRPAFADDFYEKCRLLALFYNGRINYENNKKGMFGYFQKMNCLYLLTDTLEFLKDTDMAKGSSYGNKMKGTNATQPVNIYARQLLRDWLMEPITIVKTLEDGTEEETKIMRLYTLRNRALLQELSLYNDVGNFDRISSMGMLMLLRQDKIVSLRGDVKGINSPKNYKGDDSFFKDNYGK